VRSAIVALTATERSVFDRGAIHTGNTPGNARSITLVCAFGSPPNAVAAGEKILLASQAAYAIPDRSQRPNQRWSWRRR